MNSDAGDTEVQSHKRESVGKHHSPERNRGPGGVVWEGKQPGAALHQPSQTTLTPVLVFAKRYCCKI